MKKISILFMLLLGITSLHAQQFNITGTVIDKKLNEPIIGATVQVKGTNNGTVTNLDGEFALKKCCKRKCIKRVLYRIRNSVNFPQWCPNIF